MLHINRALMLSVIVVFHTISVIYFKELLIEREARRKFEAMSEVNKRTLAMFSNIRLMDKQRAQNINSAVNRSLQISAIISEENDFGNDVPDNLLNRVKYINSNIAHGEFLNFIASVPNGIPATGRYMSGFGFRSSPIPGELGRIQLHTGVDIANSGPIAIHSTHGGRVIYASYGGGVYAGYGNVVVVESGVYRTMYAHLRKINVKHNQVIPRGYVVGLMGTTGRSIGNHLHYEVMDIYMYKFNPLSFLINCNKNGDWCRSRF